MGAVQTLVICHSRELACQVKCEFDRFAEFFVDVRAAVVHGGCPITKDRETLKETSPQVLIGTPGRLLSLLQNRVLKLDKVSQFVFDECDKCLGKIGMCNDIQQTFIGTPRRSRC